MSIAVCILVWSVAVGIREGYTFGGRDRLSDIEYHFIRRYLEQGAIVMLGLALGGVRGSMLVAGAMWAFTFTVYEPFLDFISTGKWVWFKKINPYNGKNQGRTQQIILTLAGIALLIGANYV